MIWRMRTIICPQRAKTLLTCWRLLLLAMTGTPLSWLGLAASLFIVSCG
jgi:hypothetical protein